MHKWVQTALRCNKVVLVIPYGLGNRFVQKLTIWHQMRMIKWDRINCSFKNNIEPSLFKKVLWYLSSWGYSLKKYNEWRWVSTYVTYCLKVKLLHFLEPAGKSRRVPSYFSLLATVVSSHSWTSSTRLSALPSARPTISSTSISMVSVLFIT